MLIVLDDLYCVLKAKSDVCLLQLASSRVLYHVLGAVSNLQPCLSCYKGDEPQ